MQSKAKTVKEYLASLPADRRKAISAVRAVIRKNLDKNYEEGMQYGGIGYYVPHRVFPAGYHCDPRQPLPFVCLGSQKNYMSVYLGSVYGRPQSEAWFREAWAKSGKRLDMGKACLRFRKIEDLALDVIGESIRRVSARGFIQFYESAITTMRSRSGRRTSSKPAKAKDRTASKKRARTTPAKRSLNS